MLSFDDARNWAERKVIMLCSQTTDTSIELYWHDGLMRSRHTGTSPSVHIPIVEEFVDRMAAKMNGHEGALPFETINRTASAHFTGGIPLGDSSETGAVDPYQRVFGQPGLHVIDGACRCSRRAEARREEGRRHPRVPVLSQAGREEKTMTELAADPFRTIDPSAAIANDAVLPDYLGDRRLRISIARVDGRLYAFDDLCTCSDEPCPLSSGLLTGTTVMCQCHGSRFDVTTGAAVDGPATEPLRVYEVQEAGGDIRIRA